MTIQDSVGVYDSTGHRYQDEAGNPIVPGRKLGEGGEGAVYLVEGQPDSVVKIWHPGRVPPDADARIRYMVNNPVIPDLGPAWRITWPQHPVMENGVIAGYTMPMLDFSVPWAPIVQYYNRMAAQRTQIDQGRELRLDDRERMAMNLALAFRGVHKAGYVIGDVNDKCVEANRQNDVAMLDCDGYGFTDLATGRAFSNNMGQPEFQAPEAQGNLSNRTQEQDLFGLAVLIFLLLTGYHPYTITGQHAQDYPTHGDRISNWLFPAADQNLTAPQPYCDAWDTLTDRQIELFMRCFDQRYAGQPRPTPQEWAEAQGFQDTASVSVPDRTEAHDNLAPRSAIVLALDVSGSMRGLKIETVNQALAGFRDILREDAATALRADVAVIEFDHEARLVQDFTNGADFEPPVLSAKGGTNYSAAVNLALDLIEARQQSYRDAGIAYDPTLVYFLTDGFPEHDSYADLAQVAARLAEMEQNRSVALLCFYVTSPDFPSDMTELAKLSPRPPAELTNMEQLQGSIKWLPRAVGAVSPAQPDDSIRLPEPDYLDF